jgi:hypothetical protein
VLIAASDGSADGRGKLSRLAAGLAAGLAPGSGVEICAPLTAAELAQALGRDHAVHAAIEQGGIAERIIIACRRLTGLSGAGPQAPEVEDGQAAIGRVADGRERIEPTDDTERTRN